jgi:hypothetical protein
MRDNQNKFVGAGENEPSAQEQRLLAGDLVGKTTTITLLRRVREAGVLLRG